MIDASVWRKPTYSTCVCSAADRACSGQQTWVPASSQASSPPSLPNHSAATTTYDTSKIGAALDCSVSEVITLQERVGRTDRTNKERVLDESKHHMASEGKAAFKSGDKCTDLSWRQTEAEVVGIDCLAGVVAMVGSRFEGAAASCFVLSWSCGWEMKKSKRPVYLKEEKKIIIGIPKSTQSTTKEEVKEIKKRKGYAGGRGAYHFSRHLFHFYFEMCPNGVGIRESLIIFYTLQ